MVLFTIWALGLVPGANGKIHPVRLGIAYFLLSSSHGLGILNAGCLAALGCFIGGQGPGMAGFLANGLLAIPGLVFNIPMLLSMFSVRAQDVAAAEKSLQDSLVFIPGWLDYQFGSGLPFASFVGWIFTALMLLGIAMTFRRSKAAGMAMTLLVIAIPVSFLLSKTSWSREWYSIGCMVFWLWAIAIGASHAHERISTRSAKWGHYCIIASGLLFLPLLPRSYDYLQYPQQDYAGAFQTIRERYPHQERIYCFTIFGITGLQYYSRRFAVDLVALDGKKPLSEDLWREISATASVMEMGFNLSPENAVRLKRLADGERVFRGLGSQLMLYSLKRPAL